MIIKVGGTIVSIAFGIGLITIIFIVGGMVISGAKLEVGSICFPVDKCNISSNTPTPDIEATLAIAVASTLTASVPTPNIVETAIAQTLTAIAPSSIPSYPAIGTPSITITPQVPPTLQPTALQISCNNPQSVIASQSERYAYTQYYTDIYTQCGGATGGWNALWSALVNGGTVSGSAPTQKSQECWGSEQTQNDQFSCATWYGIEVYILDAIQEVTVRSPHCLMYAPDSSPTIITKLSDYMQENRDTERVVTNVRVSGHFTFYIWCIANWE